MKNIFIVLIALTPFFGFSQLKPISLQDAILGPYSKFAPERVNFLGWLPQTDEFLTYQPENQHQVILHQPPKFSGKVIFSRKGLNQLLKQIGDDTLKSLTSLKITNNKTVIFNIKNKYFQYDFSKKNLSPKFALPEDAAHLEFSNNFSTIAYTKNYNIYLSANDSEIEVTKDGSSDVVYGEAVHRYEFGVSKGLFWSPQGNALAFYRNNQTEVTNYPLVDISQKPAVVKSIKYPMAGMKSEEVTLGVYHLKSGKTIYLKTDEPKEQYLTNIAWSGDEKFIYIAVLNRDQNQVKLNRYFAENGNFDKTIFVESHEKYVQPLTPITFLPENNDVFLWESERDGYNHLYLYNTEGELLNQVTKGQELVTQVVGFSNENKKVLVQTTYENGLSRILKWVDIYSSKEFAIGKQNGTINGKLSDKSNFIFTSFSSLNVVAEYSVINSAGARVKTLLTSKNPLEGYEESKTEVFQIRNNQGDALNARLIKPHNFDAKKKYPVLVYVYNGPNVQLVTNRWLAGASLWMHYFANKGYFVFTVDGRGSENKGLAFENAIFRQCGEVEIQDQIAGVNYLKTLSYVDTSKFAVHGWSYGGFMTTGLMLKTPGVFNVGVSGGGVMDWKYYEVMYTERYMDTPETNPEGYEKTSLLNKTDQLKGKLLIIHDSEDDTVLPQHAEDFLKNCVETGTQVDYFYYVGHPHNVRGKDRIHLMEKVLTYIENNL